MAILNTLGRPIFGYITDRFGFYFSSLVSFVMYFIAGFIFVFFYNSLHATTVAFILLWFNLGGWLAIAPVSTMRFFGLLHYSKNYGIVYTAYGIGAFIGMNFMNFSNYNLFFYYIFYGSIVMIIIDLINYKKLNYNF
jgi:OFA family oxalate/formate antiporter-like MFS transporter